jgi:hypothetical protein
VGFPGHFHSWIEDFLELRWGEAVDDHPGVDQLVVSLIQFEFGPTHLHAGTSGPIKERFRFAEVLGQVIDASSSSVAGIELKL